jgi:hypothetical protein
LRGKRPRPLGTAPLLLLHDALDAWSSPDAFERIVSRFGKAGIDEFVVFWPPDDRVAWLDRFMSQAIVPERSGDSKR